jgi:hypothetical protein
MDAAHISWSQYVLIRLFNLQTQHAHGITPPLVATHRLAKEAQDHHGIFLHLIVGIHQLHQNLDAAIPKHRRIPASLQYMILNAVLNLGPHHHHPHHHPHHLHQAQPSVGLVQLLLLHLLRDAVTNTIAQQPAHIVGRLEVPGVTLPLLGLVLIPAVSNIRLVIQAVVITHLVDLPALHPALHPVVDIILNAMKAHMPLVQVFAVGGFHTEQMLGVTFIMRVSRVAVS